MMVRVVVLGLGILLVVLFGLRTVGAYASGAGEDVMASSRDTVSLSVGPNLFIDDHLVAQSDNLKRTTHQPKKHPEPVFHVTPGNVRYDSRSETFQMRYIEQGVYALAESKDGIIWRKPEDRTVDAPKGGYQGWFLDEGPGYADPARRHKLAFFRGDAGLCVAFSPDGLKFTEYENNPVVQEYANKVPLGEPGSQNLISDIITGCWDPVRKQYLIVCKIWEGGYPGTPHHSIEGYRRVVGVTTSKDFTNWERPQVIVRPDPANGLEEFYSFRPMVRGNLYLGCLLVLRDDLPATPGGPVEGIGWTELVTSRDGRNWTRHQEKFLDRDPQEGRFDHAMAWCGDAVQVGDKEYIYYAAMLSGHKTDREHGRKSGLAILRKNGFVSRDAGSRLGTLKTPLAKLPGRSMTVNAVVRGDLRVRIVDARGKALRGFGWPDCLPIRGDSVAHPVKWRAGKALPMSQKVSLEFSLRDANLYGFDLTNGAPIADEHSKGEQRN